MASLLVDDKRRADVSLGPSWVAEWPVDGGSFGKVSVFLKEDPAGMVTEVSGTCPSVAHSADVSNRQ